MLCSKIHKMSYIEKIRYERRWRLNGKNEETWGVLVIFYILLEFGLHRCIHLSILIDWYSSLYVKFYLLKYKQVLNYS